MKKIEFIFLSQEDVIGLRLTMKDVIPIVENALKEHGAKRTENPPKPGIHPRPDAFLHAMPGYLSEMGAVGLKWVSSYSSNNQIGLPAVMGLIVLNDVHTGQPLAIMDCGWITGVRTGAVSGVAAKYLASKAAESVGIIGAGVQGRNNLLALNEVLPKLKIAKIYDINKNNLEAFVSGLGYIIPFKIEAVASPREAIEGSDVVVTATGRLDQPIYKESWVKEGALVMPVHHRGWENATLHKADKFVCDDWPQLEQAHREVGGFDGALPPLYAELGEIILGGKPGRENNKERIVDFNYGLAIEDVAVANEVFKRAVARGKGQTLTLMEGDIPLS
jgi:ornithine cyclodeaminase/alanine dehydrogenase-like protein (mu-crystallin family)